MSLRPRCEWLAIAILLIPFRSPVAAGTSEVYVSYHWHLHQPIYWPENFVGTNRYQSALDSITLKLSNTGNFYTGSSAKHPENQLWNGDGGQYDAVFSKDDRLSAYQGGPRNSLATLGGHPNAGASISYSGALQENVGSLGRAGFGGYGPNWNGGFAEARGWTTTGGHPKADMVGMTFHHAFSPLLPRSVLRKELQIFKEIWYKSWGGNPDKSDHSRGFWPVEGAFSRHLIPILLEEGYQWSIIANSHLARTCQNYLDNAPRGTGGWNIDPPNRADVLGPTVPANQWWGGQIDGRGGKFPAPYAYQAHKAQYIDPETSEEKLLVVVPMCDLLSYQNGFGTMGTGDLDTHIAPFANDPSRPAIVLMAHDGDNAWGGGSSYYFESVPGFMNDAAGKGYRPTTIQQFLSEQNLADLDVVHVEDGGWVNAANDWGHPQFINWLWPPTRPPSDPAYDFQNPLTFYGLETPGWTEDWRNWAVLIAATNYLETAERMWTDLGNDVQTWRIQEPTQVDGTNNHPNFVEQGWHYFLGGLDSGFMYYGTSLDDEVKQTLASNRALEQKVDPSEPASESLREWVDNRADTGDATPPSVFKPQRFPWNPGGKGWGPLTHYIPVGMDGRDPWPSEFHVWTHAFDVSGVESATLKVRVDGDGLNPMDNHENETYAGGPSVGAWIPIAMTRQTLDPTFNGGNGQIDLFLTPHVIADYYWARVADADVPGFRGKLLDYYVEAVDTRGNTHRSDIQHVFVEDDGNGQPPAAPPTPQNLAATALSSSQIQLAWEPSSGAVSYVVTRSGTGEIATVAAPTYVDAGLASGTEYSYTVVARNAVGDSAPSEGATATTEAADGLDPPANLAATVVSATRVDLAWDGVPAATNYEIVRDGALLATVAETAFSDTGVAGSTTYGYEVVATNAAETSPPSSLVHATTPSDPANDAPFAMDGVNDSEGYRILAPGMTLYAAVRGNELYVATWTIDPGGANDHFILVSDTLDAQPITDNPWGKAGRMAIPGGRPFLAAESSNGYAGWTNAAAGAVLSRSPATGGAFEGVLNLVEAFGELPETLYVATVAFGTANGAPLAAQAPAGNGNSDLEPDEFLALPIQTIRDSAALGILDFLDPGRELCATPLWSSAFTVSWPCVPGRTYEIRRSFTLAPDSWELLETVKAPSGASVLEVADPDASGRGFYRVTAPAP